MMLLIAKEMAKLTVQKAFLVLSTSTSEGTIIAHRQQNDRLNMLYFTILFS